MANPNYLEKIKVGILTFGDGRDFLQKPLTAVNKKFTKELEARLRKDGFQVVVGRKVLWKNSIAEAEGRRMMAQGCHAVIFNFAVWAWPQYARVAAQFCPQPILMFSNVNPQYPGLVGMLANAGSLDQVGIKFYKTFGDINDKTTYAQVKSRLLAIAAYNGLKGLTYGLFGGRALGIDTAVADPALWMKKFGIDVDHVDQMELVRRAELHVAKGTKVDAALKYLKTRLKKIHWTEPDAEFRLTEELLRKQLGMYYAAYDLAQEFGYGFCGIKGQRELTEHYVTADVAEAFLNDPYHPDGTPKEPIVCSTEADMDAALTMKILNLLSGEPALFADIRHYHADLDAWDLCNSGEHATFFAARSWSAPANLKHVEFRPEGFYFPAGGASVYHFAAPGEVTLARLTRSGDTNRYRMAIMTGKFLKLGADKAEKKAREVQDNWPHAYCKLDNCSLKTFVDGMNCNHIHAAYGNWLDELVTFCEIADVEPAILRD